MATDKMNYVLNPDSHFLNRCIKENMKNNTKNTNNPYLLFPDDIKHTKHNKYADSKRTD